MDDDPYRPKSVGMISANAHIWKYRDHRNSGNRTHWNSCNDFSWHSMIAILECDEFLCRVVSVQNGNNRRISYILHEGLWEQWHVHDRIDIDTTRDDDDRWRAMHHRLPSNVRTVFHVEC